MIHNKNRQNKFIARSDSSHQIFPRDFSLPHNLYFAHFAQKASRTLSDAELALHAALSFKTELFIRITARDVSGQ